MVAEKDRPFFNLFAVIEITNIAAAFMANIILIIVIFKSAKDLSNYRFLLLAFAANDLCFPLVHALTMPFSICLFASVGSQLMAIMANLFIFRLIVIRWPTLARFYTGINSFMMISSSVLLHLALWFLNCWFNYDSDDELRNYVQPFLDSNFPGEGQEHIGVLYYDENGLRLPALMATMGFDAIMVFWCTIIGCCTVLTVRALRAPKGKQALRTQQLQRQLFKTLVLQMIIPIVSLYFPCAGIINAPILFHLSVSPSLVSAALSFFPVVDAIIPLVGVKMFRAKIHNFLRKSLRFRSEQSATAVTSISRAKQSTTAVTSVTGRQ